VAAAHHFQLSEAEALKITRPQVDTIGTHRREVAGEARLNKTDRVPESLRFGGFRDRAS
jgi:hypothetical protein